MPRMLFFMPFLVLALSAAVNADFTALVDGVSLDGADLDGADLSMVASGGITGTRASPKDSTYATHNTAYVSFDVSMPIDSTGWVLEGHNLTGGDIEYKDEGSYISPLLAHETGKFKAPVVKNNQMKTMMKTTVDYNAIKFINPNGINNLFIKAGMGKRTQHVFKGLDPTILPEGVYTWKAPIFSYGIEHDTVDKKTSNIQFMQVGSIDDGPKKMKNNMMYTQDFYLYSRGTGNTPIPGQPIKSDQGAKVLSGSYESKFSCQADGLWGAGGDDPYRTVSGDCEGSSTTMPAGPNLDYEYGSFTLPTVHTPWQATKHDTCVAKPGGDPQNGCVNATIKLSFNYMAKKIRVPISSEVTIFAESGTAYRNVGVDNLRYLCPKENVYLKHILRRKYCFKKNYISGGASYPYFSVGYEVVAGDGKRYSARYINIPGQENGNRLRWIDTSNTQIYAITPRLDKASLQDTKENLARALQLIQSKPEVYKVLGINFFIPALKKNDLFEIQPAAVGYP